MTVSSVARGYDSHVPAGAGQLQLSCERLLGRNQKRIDYRHVIWSLIRKPGAFARYVYREEMFPSPVFRQAYDAIQTPHRGTKGDVEYLRILHLAASTTEADVESALVRLLGEGAAITSAAIKMFVAADARPTIPMMVAPVVDLASYDSLLGQVAR
jgi:hypothetical protein